MQFGVKIRSWTNFPVDMHICIYLLISPESLSTLSLGFLKCNCEFCSSGAFTLKMSNIGEASLFLWCLIGSKEYLNNTVNGSCSPSNSLYRVPGGLPFNTQLNYSYSNVNCKMVTCGFAYMSIHWLLHGWISASVASFRFTPVAQKKSIITIINVRTILSYIPQPAVH